MHAVVRTYSGTGAKAIFDLLEARRDEVEKLIGAVPGFVSYTLMRSADGGISVTVCTDKAGTDQSVAVARDWLKANAAGVSASPPAVAEGPVIIHAH